MRLRKNKSGFTVIEVLIATSVFTLAAVIASRILVDIVQLEKKSSIQNAIYEDARILMTELRYAVQQNAIDYSEYYSHFVVQDGNDPKYYGVHNGVYASRFYDPGENDPDVANSVGSNPADLGAICSEWNEETDSCDIIFQTSEDENMLVNPYNASSDALTPSPEDANAFCDVDGGNPCDSMTDPQELSADGEAQLFLINATGTEKIVLTKMKVAADQHALGFLSLRGRDLDQNGIVDVFSCDYYEIAACVTDPDRVRDAIPYPFIDDWADGDITGYIGLANTDHLDVIVPISGINSSVFKPVSPYRTNLTDLKFIISPIEDPYRALGETQNQEHPWVKIIMTLDLADELKDEYPGEFEPITLQTTVSAGVIGGISSYPPVKHFYETADPDSKWINTVLEGSGVHGL